MKLIRHQKAATRGALAVCLLLGQGAPVVVPSVAAAEPAKATGAAAKSAGRPALTVNVISPRRIDLPMLVNATGNIAAWQEAVIGAETGGLRVAEVKVNVGDQVKKDDVLATLAAETVEADLAQVRASLLEAEAALVDARANAARAKLVQGSGALSEQQITQLFTAEKTGEARVAALRAQVVAQELRLKHTQVRAPDDGSISARVATVGAVVPAGQELFRLIRADRLEWRAEVTAAEVARVRPGQAVQVQSPTGATASGRVRVVAPTADVQTRNVLVYVDLPAGVLREGAFKPGMFARGDIVSGSGAGLTLPLTALTLRDGFAYVFVVGADSRVAQVKVQTGRRSGERVEFSGAVKEDARVVASGGAFLADGDLVRVIEK
jgi:HlyD family secretion protein